MNAPLLTIRPADAEAYFSDGQRDVVELDLDRLVVSRLLVQANSGGGKSHAIRYLLESTHGRVQHVVIDREGEFATLRERFPYLLVGPGGEVAADVRGAKLLARKLMELGVSAVLDLSELSLGQQREYVARFVEAINHLPRALWHDCLFVIDEAHLFAPEKGKGESVAREAIAMLLSIGRKRGYCTVLATQRLSKLDKDAAAECLNKLIGRTSDEDVRRAGDELGFDRAAARELRSLEPGTFWTYGPAIGVDPVLVRTGKVSTQPPPRGAARAAPPTPEAIARIAGELADLPQQAADEEATAAELRSTIRRLENEIRKANHDARLVTATPSLDQRAIEEETTRRVNDVAVQLRAEYDRRVTEAARTLTERFGTVHGELAQLETDVTAALDGLLHKVPTPAPRVTAARQPQFPESKAKLQRRPVVVPPPTGRQSVHVAIAEGLSRPQQRILDALCAFEALGIDTASKSNVAVFSDASPTSSSFANNLGALRSIGLIDYPTGGEVALTPAGRGLANAPDAPATLSELHAAWFQKLSGPQGRILVELICAYPRGVDRERLADAAGASPTSSSYANNLGSLRSLGLIDYTRDRGVVATRLLFPAGLR